jgi:hypothetical protein
MGIGGIVVGSCGAWLSGITMDRKSGKAHVLLEVI